MVPESTNGRGNTAVLLIAPETGRLTGDASTLAHYISGKSGGLGDVVAALCTGLTERGIECHLATINLKKRFQKENWMDEAEWRALRHSMDPEKIHLVSSSLFNDLPSAYAGNPLCNAAEFQKVMVNHLIKEIRAKYKGKLILHSHGFLFRDYDSGGLWYGLEKSVHFHRRAPEVREGQARRIMREVQQKYSMKQMIDEYIRVYEKLNGGSLLP